MRQGKRQRRVWVAVALAGACAGAALPSAAAGADGNRSRVADARTEWVSVSPDGAPGNGHSAQPTVSDDGRALAFHSSATNLVPDSPPTTHVFYRTAPGAPLRRVDVPGESTSSPALSGDGRRLVYNSSSKETGRTTLHVKDLRTGHDERLEPELPGTWTASYGDPAVNADGRFVVFGARPDPDPGTGCRVYVLDRRTERVQRVSRPEDEARDFQRCQAMSVSDDGRKIAYEEGYDGAADDDRCDIFVYDRVTGRNVQADVTRDGAPVADRSAIQPVISGDGTKLIFNSMAEDLVPGDDPNHWWNVFVRDLRTGETRRLDARTPTDSLVSGDLTADGSTVLFNLASADLRPLGLYARDLRTGTDTLLSAGADGKPVGGGSSAVSGDGSTVVFHTYYPGVVPGDTNLLGDVFRRPLDG